MLYQVILNGSIKFERKYENEAIDKARCIMQEGFSGSLTVEKNGVIVFHEEN